MYFRCSLSKIVKVRLLPSSLRFCRFSHSSYARQFVLSKHDDSLNAKSFSLPSRISKNFCTSNIKKNESKVDEKPASRYRIVGIDLMAPHFRSGYSILKSKDRKLISSKFHTMPQKSLTLKLCRQPSKNLSTSYSTAGYGESGEKTKKEEVDTKIEIDICVAICGPNILNYAPEPIVVSPPIEPKIPEGRLIDKLTDAEIQEICNTKCCCSDSHETNTANVVGKLESRSTAENSENSSATTTSRLQESSIEKWAISPAANQSSEKLKVLSTTTPHEATTISHETFDLGNIRRSRIAKRSSKQQNVTGEKTTNTHRRQYENFLKHMKHESLVDASSRTNQVPTIITPYCLPKPNYNLSHKPPSGTIHTMQSLPYRASNQLKSNYMRMIRSKQSSSEAITNRRANGQAMQPNISQIFPSQIKPDQGQGERSTKNVCHTEQLKPVPLRFRPIYHQNYHSHPVVKNRSPRFDDPMHVGVPFSSSQWQKRQKHGKGSAIFGGQSSKNRQTVDVQSNALKWTTSPIEFVDGFVNINDGAADNVKGKALHESENALNKNMKKARLPTSPLVGIGNISFGTDSENQSRRIMSKLAENLSVVVEAPRKLKLVTNSYPELRNENDVIIQMEYVTLTDADTRHYLTGKYTPHSYAATEVGRTGSGIIIETGRNVSNVKPGDKVFVKPISCEKCSLCLTDRRYLCESVTVTEMSPNQGILSRLHVHSSEFVTKIPDNVSVLNGARTSTLSTAVRACQRAVISAGDVVMVIGGGALAIATGLAAQLMGATTVCLCDPHPEVLFEAQKLGIGTVFQIDPISPPKNLSIKVWEQLGEYPRVTFDCRGSQLTNEIAVQTTQTGGKVVIMANSGYGFLLPVSNLLTRDIDIIISTCGNDESDLAALRFLGTDQIFFANFMHPHYDLSNIHEAFEQLNGPNRIDAHIIVKCGCQCGKGEDVRGKEN